MARARLPRKAFTESITEPPQALVMAGYVGRQHTNQDELVEAGVVTGLVGGV